MTDVDKRPGASTGVDAATADRLNVRTTPHIDPYISGSISSMVRAFVLSCIAVVGFATGSALGAPVLRIPRSTWDKPIDSNLTTKAKASGSLACIAKRVRSSDPPLLPISDIAFDAPSAVTGALAELDAAVAPAWIDAQISTALDVRAWDTAKRLIQRAGPHGDYAHAFTGREQGPNSLTMVKLLEAGRIDDVAATFDQVNWSDSDFGRRLGTLGALGRWNEVLALLPRAPDRVAATSGLVDLMGLPDDPGHLADAVKLEIEAVFASDLATHESELLASAQLLRKHGRGNYAKPIHRALIDAIAKKYLSEFWRGGTIEILLHEASALGDTDEISELTRVRGAEPAGLEERWFAAFYGPSLGDAIDATFRLGGDHLDDQLLPLWARLAAEGFAPALEAKLAAGCAALRPKRR